MPLRVGDRVRIIAPDNPRLHLSTGVVLTLEDWGAHLAAPAGAFGRYRAGWWEMERLGGDANGHATASVAVLSGYDGACCDTCGSMRMRRTGSCLVCEDCGRSGGCV